MAPGAGTPNFAERERVRMETELAQLRGRRNRLCADRAENPESVGDRGDAADALQRGVDLAGIDEQSARLSWLLAGGNAAVAGQLPNGTEVRLRFPDGEEVTMRVINFIEETPAGAEDSTLTADSPLGLALFGRKTGDHVVYPTPRGELAVTLLAIGQP